MNPPPANALQIVERLRKLVVPDAEAQQRRDRAERGERSRLFVEMWTRANVPRRHEDRAIHPPPFDPESPWSKARQAVLSLLGRGVIVCLTGTRGSGKTQIAVDAMCRVAGDGRPALFRTAREMFIAIRSAYRSDSTRSETQIIAEHRRPALLVVDEIGRRGETDWENNVLFELLNQRYNDMSDTILTCNLGAEELAASLGPSIVSRMEEGGGIIECNWPSFRV